MDGAITYSEIQKIVEANMRSVAGITDSESWRTEFPQYKDDGTVDLAKTINNQGMQGLRDVIAQSILDVLTFKKATGSITTATDGVNASPPSISGDNTKIHLEVSGNVELKGAKTDLQDGVFEVT